MQIRPGSQVYVSYLIPNPSDSNVYYPQAVIKNTQTGAIIATVNLVQDASELIRYTGSFTAPADSTGNGYYMDSVAIPYTDSGHTTPSMNYGADMVTYFVWQSPPYYGGGDVSIIDYDQIGTLLDARFALLPKAEKSKQIKFPDIPIPEKVDLAPVLAGFGPVSQAISDLHESVRNLPEPEKIDLSPVINKVTEIVYALDGMMKEHGNSIGEMHKRHLKDLEEFHSKRMDSIVDQVASRISDSVGEMGTTGIPFKILAPQREIKETKRIPSPSEMIRHLVSRPKTT